MKKIAVFGYNRLSYEAISRINKETHSVSVYDHKPGNVELALENGFNAACIEFRSDEDLKNIGIGSRIDTLFCCLDEDSENVFLTLSARALDKSLQIIAIVENPDAAEKLLAAGANKIIDPYQICGRKIHDMLKRPDLTDLLDQTVFGRHDLHLAEVEVPDNSFLLNDLIGQLNIGAHYNLLLVGVINKQNGEQMHFVAEDADRRLDPGDILVILGPSREIRAFKKDVNNEFAKN